MPPICPDIVPGIWDSGLTWEFITKCFYAFVFHGGCIFVLSVAFKSRR